MQDPNRYIVYILKIIIIGDKPISVDEKWQMDDSKQYQIFFTKSTNPTKPRGIQNISYLIKATSH